MTRFALFCTALLLCMPMAHAEDAAPVSAKDATLDAMSHMVQGPELHLASLRDPFASYLQRRAQLGRNMLRERQAQLAKRIREPLEEIELDSLTLVAIYRMGENQIAMVQDSTGKGYTVRQGNYMGKNNGRVEKITGDGLFLVEQMLDPAGDIVDRQVQMRLAEKGSS
jgi:type IV pilus assembly protein PilP